MFLQLFTHTFKFRPRPTPPAQPGGVVSKGSSPPCFQHWTGPGSGSGSSGRRRVRVCPASPRCLSFPLPCSRATGKGDQTTSPPWVARPEPQQSHHQENLPFLDSVLLDGIGLMSVFMSLGVRHKRVLFLPISAFTPTLSNPHFLFTTWGDSKVFRHFSLLKLVWTSFKFSP